MATMQKASTACRVYTAQPAQYRLEAMARFQRVCLGWYRGQRGERDEVPGNAIQETTLP